MADVIINIRRGLKSCQEVGLEETKAQIQEHFDSIKELHQPVSEDVIGRLRQDCLQISQT